MRLIANGTELQNNQIIEKYERTVFQNGKELFGYVEIEC